LRLIAISIRRSSGGIERMPAAIFPPTDCDRRHAPARQRRGADLGREGDAQLSVLNRLGAREGDRASASRALASSAYLAKTNRLNATPLFLALPRSRCCGR
jgi:hypothetical protein